MENRQYLVAFLNSDTLFIRNSYKLKNPGGALLRSKYRIRGLSRVNLKPMKPLSG